MCRIKSSAIESASQYVLSGGAANTRTVMKSPSVNGDIELRKTMLTCNLVMFNLCLSHSQSSICDLIAVNGKKTQ